MAYAAEFFRWFSEETVRSEGTYGEAPAGGAKTLVTHVPFGVVALVTPWNFPAAMVTRKIAPALAAGCSVVLKPAEKTPPTALALERIMLEAGVPRGVVNVVPTTRAAAVVTAMVAATTAVVSALKATKRALKEMACSTLKWPRHLQQPYQRQHC